MNASKSTSKPIAIAFLFAYIIVRMGLDASFWQTLSEYYSYAFETVFVAAAALIYRKSFRWFSPLSLGDYLGTLIAICSGFFIFKAAGQFHLTVPFDFTSKELLFLLLFFGPVLEESIFRMALWEPCKVLLGSDRGVIAATTLLFAAGHGLAFWTVPDAYKTFVLYQTFYVVLLGIAVGMRRSQSRSVLSPTLIHLGFNFGFWLGTLVSLGTRTQT